MQGNDIGIILEIIGFIGFVISKYLEGESYTKYNWCMHHISLMNHLKTNFYTASIILILAGLSFQLTLFNPQ